MDDATPDSDDTESARSDGSNWVESLAARVRRLGCFSAVAILFSFVVAIGTFTDTLDGVFTRVQERCREFGPCEPLPTAPPKTLVGSLSDIRLGAPRIPQVTVWMERGLATPSSLTDVDLAWPGRFITYRVEFRGYGNATSTVRWTLINAETGERVAARQYGWPTVKVLGSEWKVHASELDSGIGEIWVPYGIPGNYLVELELIGPGGVILDLERSDPFTVSGEDLPSQLEQWLPLGESTCTGSY
jgi:hypothetical protein